jgi:acyl-CoA reductase-like NAD-dependent aldehyde dehydrogenase
MACIFTSSGAAARKFRYEARVGNVGVNIGTETCPNSLAPVFTLALLFVRHGWLLPNG